MDSNGLSDPYCKVWIEPDPTKSKKHKTKTHKKTLEPKFDEQFTFDVTPSALNKTSLCIEVWDWDFGSGDDFIGGIRQYLSMNSLGTRPCKAVELLKDLRSAETYNLAKSDVNINATDDVGDNAVLIASRARMWELVSLLIDKGSNPDSRNRMQWTPLHFAANGGHVEAATRLVQQGAVPDPIDVDGNTPLHIAAQREHWDFVTTLIHLGADPGIENDDSEFVLLLAAYTGEVEAIQSVLESPSNVKLAPIHQVHTPDVNQQSSLGFTVLTIAAAEGHWNLVRWLLLNTEASHTLTTQKGTHLLMYATEQSVCHQIKWLLETIRVDVNVADKNKMTSLHIAALTGNLEAATLLVSAGADSEALNVEQKKALRLALDKGNMDVAGYLFSHGERLYTRSLNLLVRDLRTFSYRDLSGIAFYCLEATKRSQVQVYLCIKLHALFSTLAKLHIVRQTQYMQIASYFSEAANRMMNSIPLEDDYVAGWILEELHNEDHTQVSTIKLALMSSNLDFICNFRVDRTMTQWYEQHTNTNQILCEDQVRPRNITATMKSFLRLLRIQSGTAGSEEKASDGNRWFRNIFQNDVLLEPLALFRTPRTKFYLDGMAFGFQLLTFSMLLVKSQKRADSISVWEVVMYLSSAGYAFDQYDTVRQQGSFGSYWSSGWNKLNILFLVCLFVSLLTRVGPWDALSDVLYFDPHIVDTLYRLSMLTTGVLMWTRSLFIFSNLPGIGPLLVVASNMVMDIITLGILVLIYLLCFSFCFIFLLRSELDDYETFGEVFLILYQVTLSAEYKMVLFDNLDATTRFFAQFLACLYLLVSSVMLLNLLIAMMNKSYEAIIRRSESEFKFKAVELQFKYDQSPPQLPSPLNLLAMPISFVIGLFFAVLTCLRKKEPGSARAKQRLIDKTFCAYCHADSSIAFSKDVSTKSLPWEDKIFNKLRGGRNCVVCGRVKKTISAYQYFNHEVSSWIFVLFWFPFAMFIFYPRRLFKFLVMRYGRKEQAVVANTIDISQDPQLKLKTLLGGDDMAWNFFSARVEPWYALVHALLSRARPL